jgi:molybdate transport system permease protein
MVAGFQAIDLGYIEAAMGLGQPPLSIFLGVALPMARMSLLTSAVLTFTHTVGEFGVVLMVGGNIPGVTRTLSIALYDRVSDGDYAAAGQISLTLLAFSVVALVAIYLRSGLSPRRVIDAG